MHSLVDDLINNLIHALIAREYTLTHDGKFILIIRNGIEAKIEITKDIREKCLIPSGISLVVID